MSKLLNQKIKVLDSRIRKSIYQDKGNGMRLELHIEVNGETKVTWTGSEPMQQMISKVKTEDYPFETIIVKENDHYAFT